MAYVDLAFDEAVCVVAEAGWFDVIVIQICGQRMYDLHVKAWILLSKMKQKL